MSRVTRIMMDWACEDIQYQLFEYGKNCNRINRRPFTREELVAAAIEWVEKDQYQHGRPFEPLQLVSELISNPHWEIEIEQEEKTETVEEISKVLEDPKLG